MWPAAAACAGVSGGRSVVLAAVDGRAAAVIADEARPTASDSVADLHGLAVRVVMPTGDDAATAGG